MDWGKMGKSEENCFENGLKMIFNFVRPGPETAVWQSCLKHSFTLNRYGMLGQLQVFS